MRHVAKGFAARATVAVAFAATYMQSVMAAKPPDTQYLFEDKECARPFRTRLFESAPVTVFYIKGEVESVKIDEVQRKSRISTDLAALFAKVRAGAEGLPQSTPECVAAPVFYPQHKRSTLTLKAIAPGLATPQEVIQQTEVQVGPKEHFYLGLDLPVTSQKTLKYDSESKSLRPKDEKSQLYLSLNYQFGDLLTDTGVGAKSVSLKISSAISRRPLDSVAAGLAYRLPKRLFGREELNMSGISFYVAHYWTKRDAMVDGSVAENDAYDGKWRVGLSFDLALLIDQVKW